MIIDTLLFNDEFDMLDIHLQITNHYVDNWIVLEASRTFSGIPKPYNLFNRLDEYNKKWNNRIQVVTLELDATQTNLVCETMMRKSLQPALEQYHAEDIVIHGDLDEIIDPDRWSDVIDLMNQHDKPVSCSFDMYMYRFDQRTHRGWKGSVVAKRRMFATPHELYKGVNIKRKDRSHCVGFNEHIGWHWTWMGNDDLVKNKVRSCIESQHRDPDQVLQAFKNLDTVSAINHKCTSEVVAPAYPDKVMKIIAQYPYLWHNPPTA